MDEHFELLFIRREVIRWEKGLPLFLNKKQLCFSGIDICASARIDTDKVRGDEERGADIRTRPSSLTRVGSLKVSFPSNPKIARNAV